MLDRPVVDYSALDDETLIRLVGRGRPDALNEFYDRYGRLVFSMAFNALGDRETAEEVTQDVFFRIWEKALTYRPGQARVSTWLVSIARYRAIDMLRQRRVRPEGASLAWDEVSYDSLPRVDGPEGAAEQAQEAQRVRAALASLHPDQRQALALAYFQGLSHSQIAAHLGEPLGTIKTRIRLGMQKLRQLLT